MSASSLLVGLTLPALPAGAASGAGGRGDSRVTSGSPHAPFPRNKQNEPAVGVALDAAHPSVLAAGSNEEIDNAPCRGTDCSFTPGIGDSGVYFSFNAGRSWTEPTYTGWSARHGTPAVGPIGTIPWYYESGLVSDGDPALAFGPAPGRHGFSWANGSRLYYATLASNFPGRHTIDAQEAIAVSRTDDVAAAARGEKSAWRRPVIASRRLNPNIFSDKEALWVDNAATSPHFGNVYVCWTQFRSVTSPVVLARSTDGGATWSNPVRLANATPTTFTGPTACTVRTDSHGTVYAMWSSINIPHPTRQMIARSFDGGRSFTPGRVAAGGVTEVGKLDPVHVANGDPRFTFDGIAGARTFSGLSLDVANGAPSGADATDELVITWSDARRGLNREQAMISTSRDRGQHWSRPVPAQQDRDRPDFPAVGIAPDGSAVYLVYDAFLAPWRTTTTAARPMQGVVRAATVHNGVIGAFTTVHRGQVGDARGSSENNLCCEFLGDYNYVSASRQSGSAVWNDVRTAAVCPAMNRFRASLATNTPDPRPKPRQDCPARFGDSDIYGGTYQPNTG